MIHAVLDNAVDHILIPAFDTSSISSWGKIYNLRDHSLDISVQSSMSSRLVNCW